MKRGKTFKAVIITDDIHTRLKELKEYLTLIGCKFQPYMEDGLITEYGVYVFVDTEYIAQHQSYDPTYDYVLIDNTTMQVGWWVDNTKLNNDEIIIRDYSIEECEPRYVLMQVVFSYPTGRGGR